MDRNWTEIILTVETKDTEKTEAIANMTVPYGIYTEDYSNLEIDVENIAHINLIDEDLLKMDRTKSKIHIYINPQDNPAEAISFIEQQL
ncbi:MAG: 50S ribosomal protein L11 methyltransferase, partial [Clostridia bacterium]